MILFVINSFLCYSFAFLGIIIFLWFNVDKTSGLVSAVYYSLPFLIPIILFNLFAFRAEANGIERLGRHLFKKFTYLLLCVAIFVMILAAVEFGWCNSDMCGFITIMAIYGGIVILLFSLLTIFLTVFSKQFAGYKKLYPYLLLVAFGALIFSAVYFFSPGHCPFANENCIAAKALEKNNPQLCDKSKLPPFCYRLLALRTGETKYCEMIDGYEDKLVGSVHSAWCYEQLREKTKSNEELQQGTVATKFADWKIYRNEEYGFELKYPLFCNPGEKEKGFLARGISLVSFNYQGANHLNVSISREPVQTYKLVDNVGGFIFSFDSGKKKWLHQGGQTSEFVPQRIEAPVEAYIYRSGDINCSSELILIPHLLLAPNPHSFFIEIENITCSILDESSVPQKYTENPFKLKPEEVLSGFKLFTTEAEKKGF